MTHTVVCRAETFYEIIKTIYVTDKNRERIDRYVRISPFEAKYYSAESSSRPLASDSELSKHASLISWQSRSMAMWQLKATRPSSQSSRKSATTSCTPHNTMYSHFPSKIHRLSTEDSRQELTGTPVHSGSAYDSNSGITKK